RRVHPRGAAGLVAAVRLCRRGVRLRRSIPRVGIRRRNQLFTSGRRDARDVWPGPSTGADAAPAEDPNRVHHRLRRRLCPSPPARARGRRVPGQAVQRRSPSGCGRRRPDMSSPGEAPVVFVVDDDVSVRESLQLLIRSAGWHPETFVSAEDFLGRSRIDGPSCLVLDVSLPNLNGLDLQKRIVDQAGVPIIFITGYGDVPTSVQAMKAGAVEFLTKPFSDEVLLTALRVAIERSRAARARESELHVLRDRQESLTPRE